MMPIASTNRIAALIVLATLALPAVARAAEVPSPSAPESKKAGALPAAVTAVAEQMRKDCRDVDGKPLSKDSDFIESADLTGDGTADFVLDQGLFKCQGAASYFSGSAGSALSVFVSTNASTAKVAWEGYVYGHTLERKGPKPVLYVSVSGAACGQKQASSRADEMACQRPLEWNAKGRKVEFAPLSEVRPFRE